MPQPGFSFLVSDLEAHHTHLGSVSETLARAGGAAGGMGAPPNAFGLIGSFIPALLQPMVDEAAQVINAGAESVTQTSSMMRATIDTYAQADNAGDAGFRSLGESL